MSWTVRCHATFEAAHHLMDYVGGPEPAHGPYDLSVDFVPTEAFVKELASRLHNRDLNTVPPFDRKNASAENVALWVADEIRKAGVLKNGVRLEEVTVWEGIRNSVTFRPG